MLSPPVGCNASSSSDSINEMLREHPDGEQIQPAAVAINAAAAKQEFKAIEITKCNRSVSILQENDSMEQHRQALEATLRKSRRISGRSLSDITPMLQEVTQEETIPEQTIIDHYKCNSTDIIMHAEQNSIDLTLCSSCKRRESVISPLDDAPCDDVWLPQNADVRRTSSLLKKSSSSSALLQHGTTLFSHDQGSESFIRQRKLLQRQSSLLRKSSLVRSLSDNRGACGESSGTRESFSDDSLSFTSSPSCSGSRSMRSELDDYLTDDYHTDFSDQEQLPNVDNLMHSLRHVVSSLASRVNKPSSRTPQRSPEPDVDSSTKSKKQNFVYQLARTYSNRIKNRPHNYYRQPNLGISEELSESTRSMITTNPQLTSLIKMNQLGGPTIGARMATVKPPEDMTYTGYTLPRKTKSSKVQSEDSGVESISTTDTRRELTPDEECDDAVFSLPSDSDDSLYYYENRLAEALDNETYEATDNLRDSAIYSDDGGPQIQEKNSGRQNISIKETIQMIEQSLQTKPFVKTEVKITEKARCIKDILKALEKQTGGSTLEHSEHIEDKAPLKSIPDRTRELIECATLTRIRQETFSVGDDKEEEELTLRKGWVKQVVELLQCDTPPAPNDQCEKTTLILSELLTCTGEYY